MKKLFTILIGCMLGIQSISAQININVNLGAQPQWGPAGYNRVDYYYLPDIETYYSVPQKQFIYLNNGNWVFNNALPASYSGYNLYNGYKVVLNTPTPYRYFNEHKVRYGKYKGLKGQQLSIKGKENGKAKLVSNNRPSSSFKSSAKRSLKSSNASFVSSGKSHGKGQGNSGGNGHSKGNGKGRGKH